jgi:hypothetical protein
MYQMSIILLLLLFLLLNNTKYSPVVAVGGHYRNAPSSSPQQQQQQPQPQPQPQPQQPTNISPRYRIRMDFE